MELHGDQAEAQDEQHSDHGDSDVFLLILAGAEGDQGIGDAADTNAVGDGVGQRHHDQSQECGNSGTNIGHIHLSKAFEHQNADIDQSGSGGAGGHDGSDGAQGQAQQEADGGGQAGEAGKVGKVCHIREGFRYGQLRT